MSFYYKDDKYAKRARVSYLPEETTGNREVLHSSHFSNLTDIGRVGFGNIKARPGIGGAFLQTLFEKCTSIEDS